MMPTLKTERLLLRPFRAEDASAVHAHCGNWKVARMLTRVPHPYTREMAESWIASHEADWNSGDEITFCIELDGEAAGAISLRRKEPGLYVLARRTLVGPGFRDGSGAPRRALRLRGFGCGETDLGPFHG